MKVPVVLIGFSGVGKTSVAQEMRRLRGYKVADTDERIEQQSSKLIKDIFRVDGEEAFRELESKVLESVLAESSTVIALGGGALLRKENAKRISQKGFVVHLIASEEEIVRRLMNDKSQTDIRPLLSASAGETVQQRIHKLMTERRGLYDQADLKLWTEWARPDQLAEIIAREHQFRGEKKRPQIMPISSTQQLTGEVWLPDLAEVVIGSGMQMDFVGRITQRFPKASKLALLVDAVVQKKWGSKLQQILSANQHQLVLIEIPSGEQSKQLQVVEDCLDKLLEAGLTRTDVVVGIGGGVVGDIAGLVASLYMRGIGLVHIPTTVVAQVDSAIGGKTGVNLSGGKNLAGTFNPAALVLSDTEFLSTLSDREYYSGLAEVIKYGLIASAEFFNWLEENASKIRQRDMCCLNQAIEISAQVKLTIVENDLKDLLGRRAQLNFGHTVGHAVEQLTGYGFMLHGEAVAIGMVEALRLGESQGFHDRSVRERVVALLKKFLLPYEVPQDLLVGAPQFRSLCDQLGFEQAIDVVLNEKPELCPEPSLLKTIEQARSFAMPWAKALRADKKRESSELNFVFIGPLGTAKVSKIGVPLVLKSLLSARRDEERNGV